MHPHLKVLLKKANLHLPQRIINLHGGHDQTILKLEFENLEHAVIKVFTGSGHAEKAKAESVSLQSISTAVPGLSPTVRNVIMLEEASAVVIDFISSAIETNQSRLNFGENLARLHQYRAADYGFSIDTFIGGIRQNNTCGNNWATFYIEQRLDPLFSHAYNQGRFNESDNLQYEALLRRIESDMPEVKPVLLHGDLWNGNVIFTGKSGVLIDACAYFGHYEMDLAMMHLFGGFHPDVYKRYQTIIAPVPGFQERQKWYQLYFLLVHVALFGPSYVAACRRCFH